MQPPSFRGKPSETHVIWRRDGAEAGVEKRFDEDELRGWCSAFDVSYETDRRVDHDRAGEPREQYRCVFSWSSAESESFDMGEDEWEIETQKTPRTFVEIDEHGVMRVKSWDTEHILDIEELWLEDTSMVFRAAEVDGTKRLDARKLKSRE
ncbi:MAG: hypothetical protein ABEJ85_02770 [Haloarculaceae archaeon]